MSASISPEFAGCGYYCCCYYLYTGALELLAGIYCYDAAFPLEALTPGRELTTF